MKKCFIISTILFSIGGFASDTVMEKCGGSSLDIAESSLRIVLNKPASGKFPSEMIDGKARVQAGLQLLVYEQKYPGCLKGLHGKTDWSQYNTVVELFEEAAKTYDLFNY